MTVPQPTLEMSAPPLEDGSFWGDAHAFWTSDEERGEEEETERRLSDGSSVGNEDPEWLVNFEKERAELEDVVGIAEGYAESPQGTLETAIRMPGQRGATADVSSGTISASESALAEVALRKFIRKRWVVEDKREVSNFDELLPKELRAMTHPFELDTFQKRAVLHVQNQEHVFVCAHTSAGKTVVAEYAIALAAKNKMRAIYTSPIKALSNQKYRDFKNTFESVGIITGDTFVNPRAQCLVMTTEILRSMLYRNDAMLNQLSVVIFDEVHYVNDPERGVVWEETIIMLPPHVSLVMLSATVPNYVHFAEWIGNTKQREVFTVSTTYRPTPLRHYLWANNKPYLLMDEKAYFNVGAYNLMYTDARAAQKVKKEAHPQGNSRAKTMPKQPQSFKPKTQTYDALVKTQKQHLGQFLEFLRENEKLPVVCFCFSRAKCEMFAEGIHRNFNVSQDTKSKIHVQYKQAMSSLGAEDRELPQIKFVERLVTNGVGVHHGGLLPIVKEIVEILFSKGLVQVLFATETFAMGVNMPARSVLFTAIRKHDGRRNRPLLSSEYTQIAGRAGRRGLDACGNVFIFSSSPEDIPNQADLSAMMLQRSTPLQSKFRLTFHMLLQLIARHGMRPLDMISRSFRESVRAQKTPILKRDLARRQKELVELPQPNSIFGIEMLQNYVDLEASCRMRGSRLHQSLYDSKFCKDVFKPGRVVLLHSLPFSIVACYAVILHEDGDVEDSITETARIPQTPSTTDYTKMFYGGTMKPQQQQLESKGTGTFTCLVLVPRGAKTVDDIREGRSVERLDAYTQNATGSQEEDEAMHIEAIASSAFNIGVESSDAQFQRDVEVVLAGTAAAEEGAESAPGNYAPAAAYVVARRVPICCFASLMVEEIELPQTVWRIEAERESGGLLATTSEDDFPSLATSPMPSPMRGGKKVKGKRNDTGTLSAASHPPLQSPEERKLWWTRIAQSLDDHMVMWKGKVTSFVIPRKMKHIEAEHMIDATELRRLTNKLVRHPCHLDPFRERNVLLELERRRLLRDIEAIQYQISEASLDLVPDLQGRLEVLKEWKFINENGSIALKGRAACEMIATDELALMEIFFEHRFKDMTPQVAVAIASAFVFPEKNDDEYMVFDHDFEDVRREVSEIHARIGESMQRHGVLVDSEDWNKLCNFSFATIAYRWARGDKFGQIVEKTILQEGTIVRAIVRLDELLRKMKTVAHIIGSSPLKDLMQQASEAIHRDIVFTSSLYLSQP